MKFKSPWIVLSVALTTLSSHGFDLANYQLVHTYDLPSVSAAEASAVTYNWDTGTLFVLGDEGDALVEVTTGGATVSTMTLTGFDDTEGLAYLGGGKFALTEERLQDIFQLTYVPGGTAGRGSLASVSFGPTVGNIGLEGISYEPGTGLYFGVKEKQNQDIYRAASLDFNLGTANITHPFVPNLGVLDLADVEVLSKVTSLVGTDHQDNLLIYSQESSRLLEVNRTSGTVISQFTLDGVTDAEGVTVDPSGNIYIVGETPRLYVLSAVPEPSSAALLLAGLGLGGFFLRRKLSPVS
jgi:uncharacterized protein YjiK